MGFLYYLFLSSKSSYVVTVLFLTVGCGGEKKDAKIPEPTGNAMIIDTMVTIIPIVTLLTNALIIVGFDNHKSINPSRVLKPSFGINLSLTQACRLSSFGIS